MSIIDPSAIDLLTLPRVSLEDRAALPTLPCIYFALNREGKVQYIGKAINPRKRWQAHHRGIELALMGGVRIAYLESDASLLPEIERALIAYFRPPLNQISSNSQKTVELKSSNLQRTIEPKIPLLPVCKSTARRKHGVGTGRIHWRTITKKNGKEYKQAWYDWQTHDGGKTISRSAYIPKRLVAKIHELELEKAPVREILKVLGRT